MKKHRSVRAFALWVGLGVLALSVALEIVPGLVESGGSRLRARYATCSC